MISLLDKDGLVCLVAPDFMTLVVRDIDKKNKLETTTIYLADGLTIRVKNTPEEVYEILQEYYEENSEEVIDVEYDPDSKEEESGDSSSVAIGC